MITIIEYKCEVCHRKYATAEMALICEASGVFDNTNYPIGLMFPYFHHGYCGIFAIASYVKPYENDRHMGITPWWACRREGLPGDSLGESVCGSEFLRSDTGSFMRWVEYRHMHPDLIGNAEFERMKQWLISKGFRARYYTKEAKLIEVF